MRSMQVRLLLLQGLPGAHGTQATGRPIKAVIDYSNALTNTNVTDELSVCDVHLCTCARACTHTQTDARANALPSLTLSLCCCQIKSWKAGHKGDCTPAARADICTAAKLTADQMRVLEMLEQLAGAADWRGVAAQERAARAVAAAVRTSIVVSTGPFIKKLLHNHSINIK